jgi:hypothetical protein
MQASFTDLVGTAVVPAHCFDSDELTDLAPVLDGVAGDHDTLLSALSSEPSVLQPATYPVSFGGCLCPLVD